MHTPFFACCSCLFFFLFITINPHIYHYFCSIRILVMARIKSTSCSATSKKPQKNKHNSISVWITIRTLWKHKCSQTEIVKRYEKTIFQQIIFNYCKTFLKRRDHSKNKFETHGHKHKFIKKKINKMVDVSDNYDMNEKTLFWKKVFEETCVDTAKLMYEYKTIYIAIHERSFDKKISVTKFELLEHIVKKRCEFVTQILKKRSNSEN